MLSEKKFIHDYHSKDDYSDFQFISSWEKNYQSWINQNSFPLKIIRYEDLNNKTFEIFKKIIEFINGITGYKKEFNEVKAKNSIKSTTFDKMKDIEKKQGFLESILSKNDSKKIPFFHLGPENNWRKILDNSTKDKLTNIFKKNLKELSYN